MNPKRESWLAQPPKQTNNRHSVSSFASQVSYDPSEIGEAVSVPVQEQRGDSGEVKQMYVNKRDNYGTVDEEESLFSESQAQLGRLDTIKRHSQTDISPEVTVETELRATVPPRSKRRPVSEITPRGVTATEFTKTHHPRVSLNISDDLDKLMQSARDLKHSDASKGEADSADSADSANSGKSVTSGLPIRQPSGDGLQKVPSEANEDQIGSGSSHISGVKGKIHHMNFSTDTFETAEAESPTDSQAESHSKFALPKRPNEDNMRRARQASANHAQRLSSNLGSVSRDSSENSRSISQHDATSSANNSAFDEKYEPNRTLEQAEPDHSVLGRLDSTSSRYLSDAENQRSQTQASSYASSEFDRSLQRNFEEDPEMAEGPSENVLLEEAPVENVESESRSEAKPRTHLAQDDGTLDQQKITPIAGTINRSHKNDGSISSARALQRHSLGLELGSSESIGADLQMEDARCSDYTHDSSHLPEIAKEKLLKKQLSLERQEVTDKANDDEYYDIEEPVLSSNTVKQKSVKGSTRKSTKRKSRHLKNKETAGNRLMPFSYNTLVHLLESINGSVIGEEFESLNLPMREKQLIEKIVDSLSRLTSDMVIDENRYEVGIDRLERAHRVLEGFL